MLSWSRLTDLKLGFHWGAEKLDSLTEFSEVR
jgi:hypothetical protein